MNSRETLLQAGIKLLRQRLTFHHCFVHFIVFQFKIRSQISFHQWALQNINQSYCHALLSSNSDLKSYFTLNHPFGSVQLAYNFNLSLRITMYKVSKNKNHLFDALFLYRYRWFAKQWIFWLLHARSNCLKSYSYDDV